MLRQLFLAVIFSAPLFVFAQPSQNFFGSTGPINDVAVNTFTCNVTNLNETNIDTFWGLEKVTISLTHTWDADLTAEIISPDGTSFLLFSGVGGDGDNFQITAFKNTYTLSIMNGSAPFNGNYRPMGDMAVVNNNQVGNGQWRMVITDSYGGDDGDVISWSLRFTSAPATPIATIQSSNLPLVIINTQNYQAVPDEPKIVGNLRIIDHADAAAGIRNLMADSIIAFNGRIGIERRGSSSGGFPKYSYGIETWDSANLDIDTALMGMPAESDWVLIANYADKSLMRNAISYDLGRKTGHWAPRTRFCEVVLNGQYMGVYFFGEKIKRNDERVSIAKLTTADTAGVNLTGGYIFKVDKMTGNGGGGWHSGYAQPNTTDHTYFQYEYPADNEILPQQAAYLQSYVDSFEDALAGNDFQDPVNGWRKFAGEGSFIDYMFVNELSKNVDGYRISTYLHKEKSTDGNKIKVGPLWDFDIAWFNSNYCEGQVDTGWAYNFNYVCGSGVPFWWERMMQDSGYQHRAYCRWVELRNIGALHNDSIYSWIDNTRDYLAEGAGRNFTKWPILGVYTWPEPAPLEPTYDLQVQKLKDWIQRRLLWMDMKFSQFAPPNPFAVSIEDTLVCGATNLLLTPGSYAGYNWSTGATTAAISVSTSGNYVVTVEDNFGCYASDNANITFAPLPDATYTYTTAQLSANFAVSNTSANSYLWNFGNGIQSNQPNPAYNFDSAGTYTVSLTTTDSIGCSNTTVQTITVSDEVGVQEIGTNHFRIFPNPAQTQFTISGSQLTAHTTLRMFNTLGEVVLQSSAVNIPSSFSIAHLPAGVYSVEVSSHEMQRVMKLVKE